MTSSIRARRLGVAVATSLLVLPFSGSSANADALPEACDPAPHSASSFCVGAGASIGPTLDARDPFDVDVAFENTSDSHVSDRSTWIDAVTVHLSSSNASAPAVTPSVDLPDGLVIAGDDNDCSTAPFTACDAGHGTFVVNVTNTPGHLFDGDYQGTFGILRVLNVNDGSTQPATYRYAVDVEACVDVPGLGSCFISETATYPVEGPVPSGAGSGSLDITIPDIVQSGVVANSGGVAYTGTLDSGEIHLRGTASKVHGDPTPLDPPAAVFRLPARCGSVSGSAEFASNETVRRTVRVPQTDVMIGGCPTAAFTPAYQASTVGFDGTASAAHVAGRTVSAWKWVFGDGKSESTMAGSASHAYPAAPTTARDYRVSLVVVDDHGAVSGKAKAVIHGTATALVAPVKTATRLKVPGKVSPSRRGKPVTVLLQRRHGGAFRTIGTRHPKLNASSAFTAVFPRPASGFCRAVARYGGDPTHLASKRSKTFSC
jgi:hypothetical protein